MAILGGILRNSCAAGCPPVRQCGSRMRAIAASIASRNSVSDSSSRPVERTQERLEQPPTELQGSGIGEGQPRAVVVGVA